MQTSSTIRHAVLGLCLGLLLGGPGRAARGADPSEFLRRLESIGLSTRFLRAELLPKLEFFFRKPSSTAQAQYGYILNNVYIPTEQREVGSHRIRFDLEVYELNTLLHELVHAARDLTADEDAPRGTPARVHWEVVNAVWADIFNDPEQANLVGLPRYPRFKADEVIAYFIGDALMEVFEAADMIVLVNTRFVARTCSTPGEAERLGVRLVMPADTDWPLIARTRDKVFGRVPAGNDHAFFEGEEIPWREREFVTRDAYQHVLGLDPPRDSAELLERMNAADNEWIREVRQKVRAARREWIEEQKAGGEQEPASFEGLQGAGAPAR